MDNNTNNQNNRVVEFTTPNEKDIIFCAGANGVNDIGHYLRNVGILNYRLCKSIKK